MSGDVSVSSHANAGRTTAQGVRFDGTGELRLRINTVGYANLQLSYYRNSAYFNAADEFRIDYSTDGTTFFDPIDPATGLAAPHTASGNFTYPSDPNAPPITVGLPVAADPLIIRFRTTTDDSLDYVYFDDVLITGEEVSGPECVVNTDCTEGGNDNECTQNNCVSGTCEYPNHPVNTACSGGVCDGAGTCVECTADSQCPDPVGGPDPCSIPSCDLATNTCGFSTPDCSAQPFCSAGNSCVPGQGCIPPVVDDMVACTIDSCDEMNRQVVNQPDDSACPDTGDGNECTVGVCDPDAIGADANGCVFANVPNGTLCSQDGGRRCFEGACVECIDAALDCHSDEICDPATNTCVCTQTCETTLAGQCGTWIEGCQQPRVCTCDDEAGEVCTPYSGSSNGVCAQPCGNRTMDAGEGGRDCGGTCGVPCNETVCTDDLDDDGDGLTDCEDADCRNAGQCDRCEPAVLGSVSYPVFIPEFFLPGTGTPAVLEFEIVDTAGQCSPLGPATMALGSTGSVELTSADAGFDAAVDCLRTRPFVMLRFRDPASGMMREAGATASELFTEALDDDGVLTAMRLVVTHSSYDESVDTLAVDFHWEALGHDRFHLDCLPCGDFGDEPLSATFCTEQCRCDRGEGGCQQDSDCKRGLVCADAGPLYGIAVDDIHVCVPESCANGQQDGEETGVDCGGSLCGACPADCSAEPACSPQCPCDAYEGPCDSDAECSAGNACGIGVGARFGMPHTPDVCWPDSCDTGSCGSAACGPCEACDYQVTDCVVGGGTREERISFGTTSLRDTPATFVNAAGMVEYVGPHVLRTRGGLKLFEGEGENLIINSVHPERLGQMNIIDPVDTSSPAAPWANPTDTPVAAYAARPESSGAGSYNGLETSVTVPYRAGQLATFSTWTSGGGYPALQGGTWSPVTSVRMVESGTGDWSRGSLTDFVVSGSALQAVLSIDPFDATPAPDGLTADFAMPQLELGAIATSYIPTVGTTATRGTDHVVLDAASLPDWFFEERWTMEIEPLWDAPSLATVDQRFVIFELGGDPDYWLGFESIGPSANNDGNAWIRLVAQAGADIRKTPYFEVFSGSPITISVGASDGWLHASPMSDANPYVEEWTWPRDFVSVGARGSGGAHESAYAWLGEPTRTVTVPAVCDVQTYADGTPCDGGAQACVGGACTPSPGCGNGVVDGILFDSGTRFPAEQCDDGNNAPGDGCSPECVSEALTVAASDVALHEPGISTHAVAADGQGRLLFVWQSIEGEVSRLLGVRATPAGVPVAVDVQGPLVIAGDLGAGWPAEPQVVGHPDGGWTVVWTSGVEDGDASRAVYRYIDPDEGSASPLPARLVHPEDEQTARHERTARVGALEGGFVVAWVDERTLFGLSTESSVKARLFDHTGTPTSGVIDVSDEDSSQELRPTVAAIGSEWMAAWVRLDDDSLRLRRFEGARALEGEQIAAYDARAPAAVGLPSASSLTDYALAFSHESDHHIYVIELLGGYTPNPADVFRLTSVTDGRPEEHPSLATLGDDAFVVAFGYGDGYRDSDFGVVERSTRQYSPQPQEEELLELLQGDSNQRDVKLAAVPGGVWFSWTDDGAPPHVGGVGDPPAFPHQLRAYLLACPDCGVAVAAHCFDDPSIFIPDGLALGSTYAYGGPRFGERMVVYGEWAFVSAPRNDDPDNWSGSVHVYRYQAGAWAYHQDLWGANPAGNEQYGISLDVDGETAVVVSRDRAHVHWWNAEAGFWEYRQELLHPDLTPVVANAAAISGDAIVVGDAKLNGTGEGELFVFRRDESNVWTREQVLTASGSDGPGGLGAAVDIEGDRIAAGAFAEATPEEAYFKGAAYIFERGASGWEQTARFQPEDMAPSQDWTLLGTPFLLYGAAVQLVGDGLLVAAMFDSYELDGAGAVYWYRYDGSEWVEHDKLVAPDMEEATMFGQSIASDGHALVVGALGGGMNQGLTNSLPAGAPGSAYVFHRDPSRDSWVFDRRVQAPAPRDTDLFGNAVAIFDGGILVGAAAASDGAGANPGALYAYSCAPSRNCGDGWITGTEECDDGNGITEACQPDPDCEGDCPILSCMVCSASCTIEYPLCGNANVDAPLEECDEGPFGGLDYCPLGHLGQQCQVCGPTCTNVTGGYCGDGIVNGAEECDDGNAVSQDGCEPNCRAACDAGGVDICNGFDDDCDGSVDEGADASCDDSNECTSNTCVGGLCQSSNVSGPCDDGSACTTGDTCNAGVCAGTDITCEDNNPCTDNTCNPLQGCDFVDNTAPCDDGDPCTTADVCGGGVCAGVPAGCADGDLCCPTGIGCHANNDDFCQPVCPNGEVEGDETCDGNCPTDCDDADACTQDVLSGDPLLCNVQCTNVEITTCGAAEGCCPAGCNSLNDPNCPVRCGDGATHEPFETCDGDCPTECFPDGDACTLDVMLGDPSTCDVVCNPPITACVSGDGCCPGGCERLDDVECPPPASPVAQLEAGTVPVPVGVSPITVDLANTYESPVVVAIVHYANNFDLPVVARVTNVTATSFDVYLQVAAPSGMPEKEKVSYLVVEEGVHTIDGLRLEAHRFWSTVTDGQNSGWAGEQQVYAQAYTSPVVLGQVMTDNDPRFSAFYSRGSSVSSAPSPTALYIGKQRGEDTVTTRADELLGYVVLEAGSGTLGGVAYDTGLSGAIVSGLDMQNVDRVNFSSTFDQAPAVVVATQAGMAGTDGGRTHLLGDPAVAPNGFVAFSDEDQFTDSERTHSDERVSYVAFAEPVAYPVPTCGDGTVQFPEVCDDGNTVTEYCPPGAGCCAADCSELGGYCGDGIMQAGEACDDGNTDAGDGCDPGCAIADPILLSWTLEVGPNPLTVPLTRPAGERPFVQPVVVATVHYANNSADAVLARVDNVTPASFDIYLQSGSETATPLAEKVTVLVVDQGAWEIDGVQLEAWTFDTDHTASDFNWVGHRRGYSHGYVDPIVLGQVMSANDPSLSAFWSGGQIRTQPASATHLYLGKHVGADTTPRREQPETIGYVVIEAGSGVLAGVQYDAGRGGQFLEGYSPDDPNWVPLGTTFASAPTAVTASQAGVAGEGSWTSLFGDPSATPSLFYAFSEEDQLTSPDRTHVAETAGYIAFQQAVAAPAPTCGDGTIDWPEVCDDGNTVTEYCVDGSCCAADCRGPGDRCGDGKLQAGEACDDGGRCEGGTANIGDHCTDDSQCDGGNGACVPQAGDACNATCTSGTPRLQSGIVSVGQTPTTVSFEGTYHQPVVVATLHYEHNGARPVLPRVHNVTSTGFDIYLQAPVSGTATLNDEVATYLVVEQGAWTVDGLDLEAWRYDTTDTASDRYWMGQRREYGHAYTTPVVLGQVMSATDPAFQAFFSYGADRNSGADASFLHVGKHVGRDNDYTRPIPETIGYVVLEGGSGSLAGVEYSAGTTAAVFGSWDMSGAGSAGLGGAFEHAPEIVVATQTGMNGGDGSWLNLLGYPSASSSTFYAHVDEENLTSNDRGHADERAMFLALEKPLLYPAPVCGDGVVSFGEACDDGNTTTEGYDSPGGCVADCSAPTAQCGDGKLDASENCDDGNNTDGDACSADCQLASLQYEVGTFSASTATQWVSLQNTYVNPVVVATMHNDNNSQPMHARVREVTAGSFRLDLREASSNDTGVNDLVTYLVVEQGAWRLGGVPFEAWTVGVDTITSDDHWAPIRRDYSHAYTSPVVLGSVQDNDGYLTIFWSSAANATSPADASGLYVSRHMGEDDATFRNRADVETVGYVVFDAGSGLFGTTPYAAGLSSLSVGGPVATTVPYGTAFSSSPAAVLITQSGMAQNTGSWAHLASSASVTTTGFDAMIEEDQYRDNERDHSPEHVAFLAFETAPVFSCQISASNDATCDLVDDDCDGEIDEDCVVSCTAETATIADHVAAGRAYQVGGSCASSGDDFESGFGSFVNRSSGADRTTESGGDYSVMLQGTETMSRTYSSSASWARIDYSWDPRSLELNDDIYLNYRTGAPLGSAVTVGSTTGNLGWEHRSALVPLDQDLEVEFAASFSSPTGDYVYIDDVTIRPVTTDGPIFVDEFDDGTAAPWTLSGGVAQLSTDAVSGSGSLRLGGPATLTLDLAAQGVTWEGDAIISYHTRTQSVDSGEYIDFAYRVDGGPWQDLHRIDPYSASDTPWAQHSFAVPGGGNVEFRVLANMSSTSGDTIKLDRFEVTPVQDTDCVEYFAVGSDELLGSDPAAIVDLRPMDTVSGWATVAADDATCDGENDDCDAEIDEDCVPYGFQEVGGLVSMEVENAHRNIPSGSHQWQVFPTGQGDASGGYYVEATPDTGALIDTGYVGTTPQLSFDVEFTQTGTYYVWTRMYVYDGNSDTVHVGLDGAAQASADRIRETTFGTYSWTSDTMDSARATLDITTPGMHTIDVWMREDAAVLDKIVLTTSAGYSPTQDGSHGPPESTDLGGQP